MAALQHRFAVAQRSALRACRCAVLTNQTADLSAKRIELLREVVPDLRRIAIMANVDNPSVVLDLREVEATARALGLDIMTSEIYQAGDIAPDRAGKGTPRIVRRDRR